MSGEREGVAAAEELAEAAKALESGKVLRLLEEKRHLLEERLGQQELLECEAVARLLEDQVELALEVAQRMEGQAATVLRSYCLYQMRKTEEASKEMEGCQAKMDSETRQRMADHLRAQIAFRMGRGDEAARAYKEMIENSQGSVEELVVNAMAALVVDGRPQEALELANVNTLVNMCIWKICSYYLLFRNLIWWTSPSNSGLIAHVPLRI